jgi:uncharacterized lipoprotein YehR (DUF1307 family)
MAKIDMSRKEDSNEVCDQCNKKTKYVAKFTKDIRYSTDGAGDKVEVDFLICNPCLTAALIKLSQFTSYAPTYVKES